MVRLWMRARMSPTGLALIGVGLVASALLGAWAMPIIRVGLGKAPFSVLIPVLPALGILALTASPLPLNEARARRRGMFLLRLGWVAAWLGLCCVALAADGFWTGNAQALESIRNILGYYGCAALIHVVGGRLLAYAAPATYAVAVAILGSDGDGAWSWPIHSGDSMSSWVAAAALACLGAVIASHSRVLLLEDRREEFADDSP